MKVAVVCREHPIHYNGGLSIASWNTARAARDAGVDILFMTATRPDGFAGCEVIDGIRVLWLPETHHANYPKWHAGLMSGFDAYHKAEKFDIIHCHGYSGSPIAIRGIDVPIIFHDHGSKEGYVQTLLTDQVLRNPGGGIPRNLDGSYDNVYFGKPAPAGESDFDHMRRYDMIFATSEISHRDFRTRYLITHAELFYHCIYDLKPVYHVPSSPPIVAVFAGDLDNPWKCGTHFLSKLLPLKDEIHLKLIGPGKQCGEYAKKNFPLSTVTGHLSEAKAMGELSKVDVLFEPSTHHIGLNLTGISAIGLGVPVVAFPTAGHYDLIGDGDNGAAAGIIVDPVNANDEICLAIKHVIRKHKRFSDIARIQFDQRFSPKTCSMRIKYLYNKVLGK